MTTRIAHSLIGMASLLGLLGCTEIDAGSEDTATATQELIHTVEEDGALVTKIMVISGGKPTGAPTTSWFGAVHVTQSDGFTFGGWVDGNGPDTYQAHAECYQAQDAHGLERWAGDRRQSHARCVGGILSAWFILRDK